MVSSQSAISASALVIPELAARLNRELAMEFPHALVRTEELVFGPPAGAAGDRGVGWELAGAVDYPDADEPAQPVADKIGRAHV